MNYLIPLAIVVLIVIIYFSYKYGCSRTEMSYLQGFWESNSEFNKEAGLQLFSMYIGDPCGGAYPSYVLMIEDGEEQTILINEPTSFTISEPMTNLFKGGDCREFRLVFKDLETKLLPCVLTLKYYASTCKMVLSDHKRVYACFFKNPVLSELQKIKEEENTSQIKMIDNKISIKDVTIDTDVE